MASSKSSSVTAYLYFIRKSKRSCTAVQRGVSVACHQAGQCTMHHDEHKQADMPTVHKECEEGHPTVTGSWNVFRTLLRAMAVRSLSASTKQRAISFFKAKTSSLLWDACIDHMLYVAFVQCDSQDQACPAICFVHCLGKAMLLAFNQHSCLSGEKWG